LQHKRAELDTRRDAETTAGRSERRAILRQSEALERKLFPHSTEAAGLVSAALPSLKELQRELDNTEGIVAYLRDEDSGSLFTFCLDSNGLQAATKTEEPTLDSSLDALGCAIGACERDGYPAPGGGGEEADWQAALTALGDRLLAAPSALGWLSGDKQRLTFVPSSRLFGVPFAALGLPGGPPYRPLVAAVEVALAPQAYTRLYQKGKGEMSRGAVAILNPDGSLGSSARERALLARCMPGIEIHRGDTPSRSRLTAQRAVRLVSGRRLVHLTCHGRHEPDAPWQSALLFAGDGDATRSHLTALQLYGYTRGTAKLIFAAACESGKANVLAGDALLGLNRALLFRSRQVVAALFAIRDDATADLEREFYRAYATTEDAVSSLALAQRTFATASAADNHKSERPRGYLPASHPYWWAGLVAFG
jgi:hypothetical protein